MTKILHDCDPGHDDMIAIMVALASDQAEVLGITTVAGNQTGRKTFLNARKVLTLIGMTDVPVARGADGPLLGSFEPAAFIHGQSGLDGAVLPEPAVTGLTLHAVDFLAKTIAGSSVPVTLVPTGPLTNIALLLRKVPEAARNIERIVLIGGAARDSNITPAAEFNIYVDPEAAEIVFTSGLPITQIGLDVTHKCLLTYGDIEAISAMNGPVSRFVGPLLMFFADTNKRVFGIDGAPVHDALAIAAAIDPSVIKTRPFNVVIERNGMYTRGQTVVDRYGVSGRKPNVDFAVEVDSQRMRNIMMESIRKLDDKQDKKI